MLRQRGWVAYWASVTHRYCFKTAKPILKLFNLLVATSFWFLVAPAPIPSSKGNPLSGAINTRGNWRFSTEIAVYLGNGTRWADR